MIFPKIIICFLLSLNIFAADNYVDSITLTKIKKLIEKEEEIAVAYKKYLLEKGNSIPISSSNISTLKSDNYLPNGFDEKNPFGKEIKLILDENSTTSNKKDDKHNIEGFKSTDPILKSNLYDYYYSNKYRTYTKAPLSIKTSNVEIILSPKEKFIYENSDQITAVEANAISATASEGKYYLDKNGIFHMYQIGKYKFSVSKDLIVDKDFTIFESDGKTVTDEFKGMTSNVIFAGQNIIHGNKDGTSATEYLAIDEETIIIKNPEITLTTDKGLLHFGNQSGGMIVNGDIYTWGNNENRITSINIDSYKKDSGSAGTSSPVINTLVRAKVKMYDNDSSDDKDLTNFYAQNYFSSPLRPKFIDLFSDTSHGTCGITTNGELYCGGTTGENYSFGNNFTQVDTTRNGEMLYRSTFFDGLTDSRKAKKVFALNQLWLILSQDGNIYRWGTEDTYKNGFSGIGSASFNIDTTTTISGTKQECNDEWVAYNRWWGYWKEVCKDVTTTTTDTVSKDTNKNPEKVTTEKFTDITYTFTQGYRKIAALSKTGDIYIWGMDTSNSNMTCTESTGIKSCTPTKVSKDNSNLIENITFKSIKGGVNAFIAVGTDGKYYKINQPKDEKIQVEEILKDTLPDGILSIDLTKDETVVYVNANNKLISEHFKKYDDTFNDTIDIMDWKSVKVLEAENDSMCALNTDNQLYCWGYQSYTDNVTEGKNTFMLPVFNTNLYDSTKDYMIAEGGTSEVLTSMTSGTWDKSSSFYIKYPTYIGGFNYEVIFK